ncbi:MAG: type III-B CRISPR module RAMP protein Cmr4 [Verrucomicrobia bacterium]|nr:type III-B CRISPR module RAMP protein Cmr4 [Verrucomicrobiota bacterium]
MIETRLLYLFTRTPLHVGAGASVGAIDQPIIRERHTGFPIIPGSTIKGVFADEWTEVIEVTRDDPTRPGQTITVREPRPKPDRDWLFGKGGGTEFNAGALQFGEARLLAFPIRSARGSFAWITCPLILARAKRDRVLSLEDTSLAGLQSMLTDDTALFSRPDPLAVGEEVVLEDYGFTLARAQTGDQAQDAEANRLADRTLVDLADSFKALLPNDPVWQEVKQRLVIVSNGMMTFFVTSACEVAQHVRINDTTGTADDGGLFNQENVPADSLFYSVMSALPERGARLTRADHTPRPARPPNEALRSFWPDPEQAQNACAAPEQVRAFQFGADASTGLGYCSVKLATLQP